MAADTVNFQQPFPLDFFEHNPALLTLVEGNEFELDLKKLPREKVLLRWVNRLLQHAADGNSKELIRNFGNDMKYPLVFYQLLRRLNPEILSELPNENTSPQEVARMVLEAARDSLDVETTYQPKDLCSGDATINMTFIFQIFNKKPGSAVLWKMKYDKLVEGKRNVFPSYDDFGSLKSDEVEDKVKVNFGGRNMGVFTTIWKNHIVRQVVEPEIPPPLTTVTFSRISHEDDVSVFSASFVGDASIEERYIDLMEKRGDEILSADVPTLDELIHLSDVDVDEMAAIFFGTSFSLRGKLKELWGFLKKSSNPNPQENPHETIIPSVKAFIETPSDPEKASHLVTALQNNDDDSFNQFLHGITLPNSNIQNWPSGNGVHLTGEEVIKALLLAAEVDNVELVELLLEKGLSVDLTAKSDERSTALHIACRGGLEPLAKLLLVNQANINFKNILGETPLMLACQNGHENVVQLLINRRADLEEMTDDGNMALHEASKCNQLPIVLLLLEIGGNFDVKNNVGDTPLIVASREGHFLIVRLLLQRGTDKFMKNAQGQMAMDVASNEETRMLLNRHMDAHGKEQLKELIARVDSNDEEAQFELAERYNEGKDVPKDETEATRYYKLAADQGHCEAQYNLGVCYGNGLGVTKDETEATRYYTLAADQGHIEAQFYLAVSYEYGEGATKNDLEAARYYKLLADQGHAEAQCNLGECYANGRGVVKDEAEAIKYYKLAADQGDDDAQYNLGVHYADGYSKRAEAAKYFKLAADQGHVEAQCKLGWCYENGRGVIKNEVEAVKYYKLAADQGDDDAQYNLGVCYAYGRGVAKNAKEAFKYYTMAAIRGDVDAQYNLGVCYEHGFGVIKDEVEAVKCYTMAADQGHAGAEFYLGTCYEYGRGIAKSDAKAVKYCKMAADQGIAEAQFILGARFENGRGVTKNATEAAKYYKLAADQGHTEAQSALNKNDCTIS